MGRRTPKRDSSILDIANNLIEHIYNLTLFSAIQSLVTLSPNCINRYLKGKLVNSSMKGVSL